jgi:hypothetical protein
MSQRKLIMVSHAVESPRWQNESSKGNRDLEQPSDCNVEHIGWVIIAVVSPNKAACGADTK